MSAGKLVWAAGGMLAAAGALWGSGVADRRPRAPGGWDAADVRPAGPDRDRTPDRRSATVVAEGRLAAYPGAEVVVGSELAGTVVEMPVNEKSSVRKGDLIAALRADDLRASRAETAARVAEAEANIRLFERELSRAERLSTRAVASSSEVEVHRRDLDAARARRAAALAAGAYLDALLAKSRVVAPIDGTVIARHAHPGETLALGARLVTVADMSRVRVEAEVDEYDSGRVAPGAPVTVTAEGFPGATWRAKVEEIPDAVTPRRIRPEDPGRPSDTRVLLVKIALEKRTPLKLGQRVEVEIRAAKSAEAR